MRLSLILLATQLAASPLISDGVEPTSLQHWYTVSVPQESGVYSVEVFAPALPAIFAQDQILVLDEPLRVDVPEPGTSLIVTAGLLALLCFGSFFYAWRKETRRSIQFRDALHDILRWGDDHSREIARKALEE